jgi:hypothetical protein
MRSETGIAKCKMQIANCKLKGGSHAALLRPWAIHLFCLAICILHFAICIFHLPLDSCPRFEQHNL